MRKDWKNGPLYRCWLSYGGYRLTEKSLRFRPFCRFVRIPEDAGPVLRSAAEEWRRAAGEIFGVRPGLTADDPGCPHVRLRADEAAPAGAGSGFRISLESGPSPCLTVSGRGESGVLTGVFALLRAVGRGRSPEEAQTEEESRNELRMIDHWDNLDGSVERGYAGRSLFFRNGRVLRNTARITDYARLLASVGINAVALNNVNVLPPAGKLITGKYLPAVAKIAGIFSAWGIRTFLSVSFASPAELGGLPTADPLDEGVRRWWARKADEIYRLIPDFGGFLVKADSESRPGPYTYGRNHAEGANLLAEALAPHGGLVIWRCFVYNCHLDWRDRSRDRAKMAYENFAPLDGRFRENVILQIKSGPVDFQIREPVSPLFGAMRRTSQMMECQITQEYTGQQIDLCYLVPLWKEALEFDARTDGERTPVRSVVDGSRFGTPHGGMAGVSNVGDGPGWTGHPLAQANLYGFGRLCWQPALSAEAAAREWADLTFGARSPAADTAVSMLLRSRAVYERYTSPLGVGWFVNPGCHYGPSVDGYEYSRWGTYHRADCKGIGVDRTARTGTAYTAQYSPSVAAVYEDPKTCPEELLLFFHHLPYSWRLRDGRTLLQYIYDSHFEGCAEAERLKSDWLPLKGQVDPDFFAEVLRRLDLQIEDAREWRDVVNTYFFRKTGVPDEKKRKIYP